MHAAASRYIFFCVNLHSAKFVTASWDGMARVWSAAKGQLLAKLEGHTDVRWRLAAQPAALAPLLRPATQKRDGFLCRQLGAFQ